MSEGTFCRVGVHLFLPLYLIIIMYSQRKEKKTFFFMFLHDHMALFLGEINGEFVQISRFNSPDFATKRREMCFLPEKKGKIKFYQIFMS